MHWTFITILWNLGALFYILNYYHELQLFSFRAALLLVSGFIDAELPVRNGCLDGAVGSPA